MKFLGNLFIWGGLFVVFTAFGGGGLGAGVIVAVILGLPLLVVGSWMQARAAKDEQNAAEIEARKLVDADADPIADAATAAPGTAAPGAAPATPARFFLYLRPFDSTGKFGIVDAGANLFSAELWERDGHDDIERVVAKALAATASFVALGAPGEYVGAARVFVPDDAWRDRVRDLARAAELIVALPAANAGTLWELRLIAEAGYGHKTVYIMPPADGVHFGKPDPAIADGWERMRAACAGFDVAMPAYRGDGLLFMLGPDGKCDSHPLPDADPVAWIDAFERLLRM